MDYTDLILEILYWYGIIGFLFGIYVIFFLGTVQGEEVMETEKNKRESFNLFVTKHPYFFGILIVIFSISAWPFFIVSKKNTI